MRIDAGQIFKLAAMAAAVVAAVDLIGLRGVAIPGGPLEWAAVSVALSLAK